MTEPSTPNSSASLSDAAATTGPITAAGLPSAIGLREFQGLIERLYFAKDNARGIPGTYMWFQEEVGELTRAIRRGHDRKNLEEEFADVLAWLVSLASMAGVDIERAALEKYQRPDPP